MKRYKFITIEQPTWPFRGELSGETHEGKPVYRIYNNRNRRQLGKISWYKPWKQWISNFEPIAVFSAGCHRDIADFIENEIPKAGR